MFPFFYVSMSLFSLFPFIFLPSPSLFFLLASRGRHICDSPDSVPSYGPDVPFGLSHFIVSFFFLPSFLPVLLATLFLRRPPGNTLLWLSCSLCTATHIFLLRFFSFISLFLSLFLLSLSLCLPFLLFFLLSFHFPFILPSFFSNVFPAFFFPPSSSFPFMFMCMCSRDLILETLPRKRPLMVMHFPLHCHSPFLVSFIFLPLSFLPSFLAVLRSSSLPLPSTVHHLVAQLFPL